MLTKSAISDDGISACLHDHYGLRVSGVDFLPIGADVNSFAYRVDAEDGRRYFLKLRRGYFDDAAVTVAALLHARGITPVMAPMTTATGALYAQAQGFIWLLYPFFEGQPGYEAGLSPAQWIALGESMKAVHGTILPRGLAARVQREAYSPRRRWMVKAFDQQVQAQQREGRGSDDPIATRLAAFWLLKRDEITGLVARTERLASVLQQRAIDFVVCHADLHGFNVLVGAHDELAIVDWDEIILAPKERDLMSVGGGLFGASNEALERRWFYEGYGHTTIAADALAYYRYERIVADIAAYGEQIFNKVGIVDDREEGLRRLMGQFLPNEVIAIAHQTYASLA